MHLLPPLATLLGLQLLLHTTVVLAGGTYNDVYYYYNVEGVTNAEGARNGAATKSACDAIDSSDFDYYDDGGAPRCKATIGHGINDHCFKCLCKRTPGLDGRCYDYGMGPGLLGHIKCGGGC